jgi:lipid II:glycine glycyltransferase (peptidoglycan interpeptide bridge formation enzyme)
MEALSRALTEASRLLGCSHVEIRTHRGDQYLEGSVFAASRFYKLHYLNLSDPPEVLMRRFHRSCIRQRISRAEKSGLGLKIAEGKADLRTFYRLLSMTRTRRGLPMQPFAFFEALWDEFRPPDLITVLIAQKDGRAIAAVLLLTYRDRVSVEFAASDEAFLPFSPIHFLFWEAIKWASQGGFRIIDFGRTSPNNRSLVEFKERWGTECVDLPHFYYPKQAAVMDGRKEDSWKYVTLRKLIARPMPSSFRRSIGALCYRHLG